MKGTLFALLTIAAAPTFAAGGSAHTFQAGTKIEAHVTLLQLDGKVGRDTPFFNNYRPQLRSPGASSSVMCTVDLGGPDEFVAPGQTRSANLTCLDPLHVKQLPAMFDMVEGGRKVGVAVIES